MRGICKFFIGIIAYFTLANAGFAADFHSPENNNDFSGYMENLKVKIQRNWNPPECLEHDGHVEIKFSISRHGDIYDSEIVESSGNMFFDEAAKEALQKSAPFDKFPAHTSRNALTIKYSFDASVVNTKNMKQYLANADKLYNVDNEEALNYINKAIEEVDGDTRAYFLYGKRSKIKETLGDLAGAASDLNQSKMLKEKFDKKRIMASKLMAEMEQTPFSYFNLAHSYEIAGDYIKAINAIDKAISLTELNNQYKRYKADLINKNNQIESL